MQTSSVSSNELNNLHYFQPFSFIHLIEKGNLGALNEELSLESRNLTDSILINKSDQYKLSGSIKYKFFDDREKAEADVIYLIDQIDYKGSIHGIQLPEVLKSMMEENNTRFAMAVLVDGFVRSKGNYTGQVFKSIGIGILTLGTYYPVPIKSRSYLQVIILDAYNNEIAFYRKSAMDDKSPLEPKVIDKQLNNIFKEYFY
ncbi:hypothetical protein JKA74_05250 [Marivirga sp. S37H4]|uniref:Uncharacterized protein n=1 Tax=Marivirga aurantiaca TaxID=2802615 RepID=A0A934WX13_9BACT|nr:hypothetical protein [Marivirga aurantiaca]MBK6264435.1 hypothetical protein [Marivirga aurantiaca]